MAVTEPGASTVTVRPAPDHKPRAFIVTVHVAGRLVHSKVFHRDTLEANAAHAAEYAATLR